MITTGSFLKLGQFANMHLSQFPSLLEMTPSFEAFCQAAGPAPVCSAVVLLQALSSAVSWEMFLVSKDSLPSPGITAVQNCRD